ncbi:MAG TPA: hypothetical protein EYQ24_05000 [Bacteroidetes bacterium]|nr:hypothetical protein [Bacteroidota bacterium]
MCSPTFNRTSPAPASLMSRRHLTQKQHQFLEYLRDSMRETKVWPTYREIVDHFGYRSPNSVTQNLQALTKKGFLRRDSDGYHLVDRDGRDGSVGIRWSVAGGALLPRPGSERVTLLGLLQGEAVNALRLDGQTPREPDLADARYVFVADEEDAIEGESVVVLDEGRVEIKRAGGDLGSAEVLGRYVGHAGGYGLVLAGGEGQHPAAALAAEADRQRAAMGSVHAEA